MKIIHQVRAVLAGLVLSSSVVPVATAEDIEIYNSLGASGLSSNPNIMFVVAKERTKEIGIKRAVGAKRSYIIFQFVFESLLIAFIGGIFGLLISVGLIKLVWMFPAEGGAMTFLGRPILSGSVLAVSMILLTLIGLLAGLFPAKKAASIEPVDALRYE